MDNITKYLHKISYKFAKGYPDFSNEEDIAILMESINHLINENQDLVNIIKNSPLFSDFGELTSSGARTIKLTFSNIPNRGSNSDSMRNEAYDLLKQLVDDTEELSNFKKVSTGSSLGGAKVDFDGKTYNLVFKGAMKDDFGDTDVKEALVSLFYSSDITTPFDKENFESRVTKLIEITQGGINGESEKAAQKVEKYLSSIVNSTYIGPIHFLNQSLSAALTIKKVYPGQQLIRTGIFDEIRSKAQQLTGLPADKWNPGDLYVLLSKPTNVENADNIELLNNDFVDNWGDTDKPLVSISLKQANAQGGKAKALLQKYTKVKSDYNLTPEERGYGKKDYMKGINILRKRVLAQINQNENIEYDLVDGELKDDLSFLRGKYAALKSINFLFEQFPNEQVDDALIALVGFALSLSGVNPTFFKVTGQKTGQPNKVDVFPRGQNVILYNVEGEYNPIKIYDKPTFGGLTMDFEIIKGESVYSVTIDARNNGTTQGSLEIRKIKKVD